MAKLQPGFCWLCTFGLFGVGQLVDLLLIPNMVEDYNTKMKIKRVYLPNGVPALRAKYRYLRY
jgi:hypothetical protein